MCVCLHEAEICFPFSKRATTMKCMDKGYEMSTHNPQIHCIYVQAIFSGIQVGYVIWRRVYRYYIIFYSHNLLVRCKIEVI